MTYEELERLAYIAGDPVASLYAALDDAEQEIELLNERIENDETPQTL